MPSGYSPDDLTDFLTHAGERGLIPAATAQALAVATRNVFSVLDENERVDLHLEDIEGVIRRFNNKRARDFNPTSLAEYGRRVKRAVELYLRWREDPAKFTVKTRATNQGRKKEQAAGAAPLQVGEPLPDEADAPALRPGGYSTAFPVRPGQVVTISNIPHDLSTAEAERLAQFIRLLAPA